jgi:DNA-binding response OmpR family regulator
MRSAAWIGGIKGSRLSGLSDESGGHGNNRPPRVIVVDDDTAMQHMLANHLEQYNMQVVSAAQKQEVTRQFAAGEPDLVLLDVRVGEENGFDLLREIRSRSEVPAIVITGHQHDEIDRVVGLELGADDYVTEPFGLRELARIRAVWRRHAIARVTAQRKAEQGRGQFGGWQLDRRARGLTDPSGIPVTLTKGEYALLVAFLAAPRRPLSREYLLQATRIHEDVFDRSIDVMRLVTARKWVRAQPNPALRHPIGAYCFCCKELTEPVFV